MSGVDPDLYLLDELAFELRDRGRNPKGAVTVLRKQLREALSAGCMLSAVDIVDKDRELEMGSSRGVRSIRQHLTHLNMRLQNLDDQWGTLEQAHDIKTLIEQVTSCLLYTSRCV